MGIQCLTGKYKVQSLVPGTKQTNKALARMFEERNPSTLLVGMSIRTATIEISIEVLPKTTNRLPTDPVSWVCTSRN